MFKTLVIFNILLTLILVSKVKALKVLKALKALKIDITFTILYIY